MAASDERLSDDAVRMYAGLVTRYRPTEYDNIVQHEGDPREVLATEVLALRAERDRLRAVVEAIREAVRHERDRQSMQFYDPAYSGSRRASPLLDAVAGALAALDREEASR